MQVLLYDHRYVGSNDVHPLAAKIVSSLIDMAISMVAWKRTPCSVGGVIDCIALRKAIQSMVVSSQSCRARQE